MTYHCDTEPVNYSPNSLNGNSPHPVPLQLPPPAHALGYIARSPISKQNDFYQAGLFYQSLCKIEQVHLCENIARELCQCRKDIVDRAVQNFTNACPEWGAQVLKNVRKLL